MKVIDFSIDHSLDCTSAHDDDYIPMQTIKHATIRVELKNDTFIEPLDGDDLVLLPESYQTPLRTVVQAIENMPSLDKEEKEYLKQELQGMIERYSE